MPVLTDVLRNTDEDPMVRHEVRSYGHASGCSFYLIFRDAWAAEAMGAIGSASSLPVLREFLQDSNRSVRETCEIAIARIEWEQTDEGRRQREVKEDEPQYVLPSLSLLRWNNLCGQNVHIYRPSPSHFNTPLWKTSSVGRRGGRERPSRRAAQHKTAALRAIPRYVRAEEHRHARSGRRARSRVRRRQCALQVRFSIPSNFPRPKFNSLPITDTKSPSSSANSSPLTPFRPSCASSNTHPSPRWCASGGPRRWPCASRPVG